MYYVDTETCGFHGFPVLIQYGKGPEATLHNIFERPVFETLDLINDITNEGITGFNLAFDWFHISKCFTTFSLFKDKNIIPMEHIGELEQMEFDARTLGCLKPRHALDLMIVAQKGRYQSVMKRAPIRIRRIPTVLAEALVKELNSRIPLSNIYFAKSKDPTVRWAIQNIPESPHLKTLKLEFHPSRQLKSIISDAFNIPTIMYDDVSIPKRLVPNEYGFAPFARAVPNRAWPEVIEYHCTLWYKNAKARQYAADDVKYTYMLWEYLGSPEPDDVDSILACMVASSRWHGFAIDREAILAEKKRIFGFTQGLKFNFNSPIECKLALMSKMSQTEQLVLRDGTKKVVLENITYWRDQELCTCGALEPDCPTCGGSGLLVSKKPHPAAIVAESILAARKSKKRLEILDKLLMSGRFHASLKITGALSNRMSGADGLNAQGIAKENEIRRIFKFADPGYTLCGGDFDSFEVGIAEAVYCDPDLRASCMQGKKFHALLGMHFFPEYTYDEIVKNKEIYSKCKQATFALLYEGTAETLVDRLGIPLEVATRGVDNFLATYPVLAERKAANRNKFCSMTQPDGIGTKVIWSEPDEYIESLLGFRRYFTLENKVCKALFDLANDMPPEWKGFEGKIKRRDREQTVSGATASALYSAAFQLQAGNMRAAGNHKIQSTGAGITKEEQCAIWSHQPYGYNDWIVQPLNIHDELMCPVKNGFETRIKETVDQFVKGYTTMVPLIEQEWKIGLTDWSQK